LHVAVGGPKDLADLLQFHGILLDNELQQGAGTLGRLCVYMCVYASVCVCVCVYVCACLRV
jgi:hypothetical protein